MDLLFPRNLLKVMLRHFIRETGVYEDIFYIGERKKKNDDKDSF